MIGQTLNVVTHDATIVGIGDAHGSHTALLCSRDQFGQAKINRWMRKATDSIGNDSARTGSTDPRAGCSIDLAAQDMFGIGR